MRKLGIAILGSAVVMGLAAPASASDDRRVRYDQHNRLERQHDRGHEKIERKHDRAHYYGVSRREHRRVHRRLEREHDRRDDRIERRHDRQHDDYNGYDY